ncbi:hypothetical protein SAMN04487944_12211 [Gracilibacillus ureilyticus]|uniref:Endospore appendages core domain-containing protein n=1 Tax=Gracilibacillus ureilyticus TaxID=531814 RepID=A0A1H9V7Z8_9BACI|nr:S-Ena type endospore appendage [Gracilibacillus ureilyticus]SES17906.1 hypothetical protein SAMN04487944_12211 [Gracilibacillus ureilyticus]
MKENSRQHCVKVLKLYDWINKVSGIQLKKPINNQKLVTDKICGNFSVSCENNQQLWSVKGKLSVSGSVTVYHQIGSDQLDVIVNGVTVAKVGKGEEIALDF